jgi:hypothetical protein
MRQNRNVRGLVALGALDQLDFLLLLGAGALFLVGLSLFRYPNQPTPTQRQDDDALFGKDVELQDYVVRFYNATLMRTGGVPRTNEMRALGVISMITGAAIAAKTLGVI